MRVARHRVPWNGENKHGGFMLTASSNHRANCYAWTTEKTEAPFFCKECLKEVILRKGRVRVHHFAHKPPVTCQYGIGETDEHHKAKKEIFEALKVNPNCSYCDLEQKVNDVIPDIYAIIKKVPVAIEIQRSNMTVQDVCDRTVARHKNGLSVIWIIPSIDQLKIFREDNQDVSRVPKWLECLHALAYGRIYVWSGNGETVMPIHFDKFIRYVPSNEFYNSDGEYMEVGGYEKVLKDRKIVIPAPRGFVDIGTDFYSSQREYFSTKNYTLPSCFIWRDSMKKWLGEKKTTVGHVNTENYNSYVQDNIWEEVQMDSDKKWFNEKGTQVSPGKFEAFGVSVWSRYGQATEIAEMLEFVRDVAWEGLEGVLEEVFYDSKACLCTFVFAPGFDLKERRAETVFLCAKKHISQFMWDDDVHHSNAIDDMGDED